MSDWFSCPHKKQFIFETLKPKTSSRCFRQVSFLGVESLLFYNRTYLVSVLYPGWIGRNGQLAWRRKCLGRWVWCHLGGRRGAQVIISPVIVISSYKSIKTTSPGLLCCPLKLHMDVQSFRFKYWPAGGTVCSYVHSGCLTLRSHCFHWHVL